MTENNAAQPGLTDDEIRDIITDAHQAYGAFKTGYGLALGRAIESALLSKLRAEGVQAGDERDAGWKLAEKVREDLDRQSCPDAYMRIAMESIVKNYPPAPSLEDPALQKLFGEVITGALAFGAQGVNPPPVGHWLEPFWQMARADAALSEGASELLSALVDLHAVARVDKDEDYLAVTRAAQVIEQCAALASAPVAKPSPEHFKPPFDNCSFRMCDLPGQCRGEGKCHHPASAPVAGEANTALNEWLDKTDFIQKRIACGELPVKYLGWHRADVMRDLIENARPSDDKLWDQTLAERDEYHDMADKLANAIADHLLVEIGEHSSSNCPWMRALEAIENAAPQASEAVQPACHVGHANFTPFYLLANLRRICTPALARRENWVLAIELFAVGGTTARRICREAGIDPDGKTITRAALSAQPSGNPGELSAQPGSQKDGPWQPIETAPKDDVILLFGGLRKDGKIYAPHVNVGYWTEQFGWTCVVYAHQEFAHIEPTHWMPRPPFPAQAHPDHKNGGSDA